MDCETFKRTLIDRHPSQLPAHPDDPATLHSRCCTQCSDAEAEHLELLSLIRGLGDLDSDSEVTDQITAMAQAGRRLQRQPLCTSSSSQPRRRHRLPPAVIALLPLPLAGLAQGAALAASLTIGIGLSLIAAPPSSLPAPGSTLLEAGVTGSADTGPQAADYTEDISDFQVTPYPLGSAHSQCSFLPPPL